MLARPCPSPRTRSPSARDPSIYRSAPATGAPPFYLHGIPDELGRLDEFLEHNRGAGARSIGFGRSGKGEHLDYSMDGLD